MRKFVLQNLLPLMFLVGAASGFVLSNAGWWGLYFGAGDLDRIYATSTQNVQSLAEIDAALLESQDIFLNAVKNRVLSNAEATELARIDSVLKRQFERHRQDTGNPGHWQQAAHLYSQLTSSRQQVFAFLPNESENARRFLVNETEPIFVQLEQSLRKIAPLALQTAQQTHAAARKSNEDARNLLFALAALASILFCLTAWLTYRESLERKRKTEELDAEHTRFKTLFESTDDALILLNQHRIIDANRAALELFEAPSISSLAAGGLTVLQPYHQPDGNVSEESFDEKLNMSLQHGSQRFEWQFRSQDGDEFPAEVAIDVAHLSDRDVIQLKIRNIFERKRIENSMRLANQAFENSLEGMTITDAEGTILTVNRAFSTITGYSADEVIGRNPRMLASGRQTPEFYHDMWSSLIERGQWQGEIWNIRKDGDIYPQWLNISRVWNEHGEIINYVGVFSDISERKSAEARILHQVYHDQLTDLPNRVLFTDRLNQLLGLAVRHPSNNLAVMILDLNLFKQINDFLGRDVGDDLLRQTAERISSCIRESDTAARMGGDEFAVILSKISDAEDAAMVAQKILSVFETPFDLYGEEVTVSASIGVSIFPGDGLTADSLMKSANLAMARAKAAGGSSYELYDPQIAKQASERLSIETALRSALDNGDLRLLYQPQFNCVTGELIGYEALLRWLHPERGLVAPDMFMNVAEESGLIIPIGAWVLQTACAQAAAWRAQSPKHRLMAVNLSSREFLRLDLSQEVKAALQNSGLPGNCLELEVNADIVMQKLDSSMLIMREVAALGVQFSISSFGAGPSLLGHLKSLPIHALKIDKSFTHDIDIDSDHAAIVRAISTMAKELGLRIVAEGIEEEFQLSHLKGLPDVVVQGYYLGRPMAREAMSKLIDEYRDFAGHSRTAHSAIENKLLETLIAKNE